MNSIEIKELKKNFGDFTAVDSINLQVKEGELFGLLGPNGAGKTTTLSMLSTILFSSSGTALVNGFDINKERIKVRKSIGIVFQDPSLDDELTAKENLDFHGRLYGMTKKLREERIAEVLKLVELTDKASLKVRSFSGGMKRRLEIARGLMHHPKILFLDEPTIGLDPQTRRNIWDYIQNLNKKEKITIILTTHYMEEADYLCDRIAIMDNGKIIDLDTPQNLKAKIGADIITLHTSDPKKTEEILKGHDFISKATIVNNELKLDVKDGDKLLPQIIKIANENNIEVKSVDLHKPTLEDVFIHLTGRKIRDDEASGKDRLMANMRQMGWGRPR